MIDAGVVVTRLGDGAEYVSTASLESIHDPPGLFLSRLEAKGDPVHAIAQSCRPGSIRENMPEVAIAAGATDFSLAK